jgi:hypothetical protein
MGLYASPYYLGPSYFPADYFGGLLPSPASPFVVDLIDFLTAACPGVSFWPGKVPQQLAAGYPAVAYLMVDGDDFAQLSGPSGLAKEDFQFDAYSTDPVEAFQAIESIRRAFLGIFPRTIGGTRLLEANRHPRLSGYDPGVDGSDDGYHRVMAEYTFIYKTST